MNRYKRESLETVDALYKKDGKTRWSLMDKLLLGLTPQPGLRLRAGVCLGPLLRRGVGGILRFAAQK